MVKEPLHDDGKSTPFASYEDLQVSASNGLMSGSHRVTGILLSIGTLLFAYWLIAAAYGADSYETAQAFFGSWLGQLMLIGWTFCLYYHLVNGIRHLLWDMGKCLEKEGPHHHRSHRDCCNGNSDGCDLDHRLFRLIARSITYENAKSFRACTQPWCVSLVVLDPGGFNASHQSL